MDFVHREGWAARSPKKEPSRLASSRQRGLAVHHSGSQHENRSDHAECGGVVKAIQQYHQDARGWNDIAYNFLVCSHGWTFEGRGWGIRSAAQGTNDGNDAWHAVCFLGSNPALVEWDPLDQALHYVRQELVGLYPAAHQVWPHLRFHATECPGGTLREWCRQWPD